MQSSNSMHYCTLPRAPHRTFKKATGNILCPPLLCVCVCVCVCCVCVCVRTHGDMGH